MQKENPRRRRFIRWFALTYGEGDQARALLMKATGRDGDPPITKGRVSQFFDPKQPFGEEAAIKLAKRLGLQDDYFLVDRPEFGEQPDLDRAAIESTVLTDLRDIEEINPETYAKLVADLHSIAEGARAAHRVIRTKTSNHYVDAARAHKKLGKAPGRTVIEDQPHTEGLLGGTSGFGELDDSQTKAKRRTKDA